MICKLWRWKYQNSVFDCHQPSRMGQFLLCHHFAPIKTIYLDCFSAAKLVINPETPRIVIIRAILKQLDNIDISAFTPGRPRNKNRQPSGCV